MMPESDLSKSPQVVVGGGGFWHQRVCDLRQVSSSLRLSIPGYAVGGKV